MRQHIEDACETIDAAMFTGDSFDDAVNREELQHYIDRWIAQLEVLQGLAATSTLEDMDVDDEDEDDK